MIVHPFPKVPSFPRVCCGVFFITFHTFQPVNDVEGVAVDLAVDMPFCAVLGEKRLAWLNIKFAEFTFWASTFKKSFFMVLTLVFVLLWGGIEFSMCEFAKQVFRLFVCLHDGAVVEHLLNSVCSREVKKTVDLLDGVFVAEIVGERCCED